ncbi:hypothetical protein L596_022245 [Steinernema carpocapsae]|uniref:Uncharacterized protein n=1 Tax=Steinernema carpocapsae TaxID=34508 RepID=A0A4U5MM04_STECR|nr:hypothetical protein L596_022245 [Steinernema carpocapsae]
MRICSYGYSVVLRNVLQIAKLNAVVYYCFKPYGINRHVHSFLSSFFLMVKSHFLGSQWWRILAARKTKAATALKATVMRNQMEPSHRDAATDDRCWRRWPRGRARFRPENVDFRDVARKLGDVKGNGGADEEEVAEEDGEVEAQYEAFQGPQRGGEGVRDGLGKHEERGEERGGEVAH